MKLKHRKAAFTLVELLVVIGIIALLISILLPSLQSARRSANAVKCSSNIRSTLQGMHLYAAENGDYFPGGAHSSARFTFNDPQSNAPTTGSNAAGNYGNANYPSVTSIFDFISPIATMLGVEFNQGSTLADRAERFQQVRNVSIFACPDNEFLAPPFGAGAATFEVGPMVSYNTAMVFQMTHNSTGANSGFGIGRSVARTDWNVPSGYSPQLSKVGGASEKVFMADGGRYSNATTPPDFDTSVFGGYGGAFSDQGAPFRFSNAWNRSHAPGSGGSTNGVDARIYAYRHGGEPGDLSLRGNFGFFDGHVETLGDLESANPNMWAPKGTSLNAIPAQMWQDVLNTYYDGQTGVVKAN